MTWFVFLNDIYRNEAYNGDLMTVHKIISSIFYAATSEYLFDEHGLYGIYDLWHKPWWQRRTYRLIALALIALFVILLLIKIIQWYIARKKQVILSSWEQALLNIQKINPSTLCNKTDTKQVSTIFYVEISKILKKYLHERLACPVNNSTDQETIAYFQAADFNPEITEMITEILNGGQYVKFAGQKTLKENMERHFNMGIAIIKKTIPNLSK